MFVCRACVKSWRGPAPAFLFAGRRAAAARAPASVSTAAFVTSTRARMLTTTTTTTTTTPERENPATSRSTGEAPEPASSYETRLRAFTVSEPQALAGQSKDAMSADELAAELTPDGDGMEQNGQGPHQLRKKQMETNVRRRYKYLNDEYTIGQTVLQMLNEDRFDEALYLARLASKEKDVVVSWNHLMKHMFDQGKTNGAIKLYQEMKKRGQVPSQRTYTIIFRGCSLAQNKQQAVTVATGIYYGMLADTRLRPNIIHMNAVLDTCARARDIQAVFNIAKTANTTSRLPDSTTYTTIFNAMRASTELPYEKKDKKFEKHTKQKDVVDVGDPSLEKPQVTIRRARATWEEIVLNWRRGFLMVDERLVCSMGRILHLGTVEDNTDVLALVEQAMGIPRLDRNGNEAPSLEKPSGPKKATVQPTEQPAEQTAEQPTVQGGAQSAPELEPVLPRHETFSTTPAANETTETEPALDEAGAESESAPSPAASSDGVTPTSSALATPPQRQEPPKKVTQFKPMEPIAEHFFKPFAAKSTNAASLYPKPGTNTLSMILAALATSRNTTLALPYWKLLVGPRYNVVPDLENCHQLLRTIKRGRSSTDAVEALLIMPTFAYVGKTFQLAMEVCTYNTLNRNTFQLAGKILDLMNQTAIMPDASALRLYLKVALTSNKHFLEGKEASERAAGKEEFGKQLIRALQRLWDPVRILGNDLREKEKAEAAGIRRDERHPADKNKTRHEYIDLLKLMVSATDMIVSEKMADEATIRDIAMSRNLINRQVTRFYSGEKTVVPSHPEKRRVLGKDYNKVFRPSDSLQPPVGRRWSAERKW